MIRAYRPGFAPHRLTHLALIWPYDPRGGGIGGVLSLDETARRSVVATGYHVVAAVRQHAPYTHVIASGGQDYLAKLVPTAAASPPQVAMHGSSAAWRTFRTPAATPDPAVGVIERTIPGVGRDGDHQEQAWESEGGALSSTQGSLPEID